MMGLLPLVRGMPMKCTDTIDRDQELFKHTRCVLEGFELDPIDAELLSKCKESEHVLQRPPKALYVRREKQAFEKDANRQHEVQRVEIAHRSWSPDAAGNVKVRRTGFQLVPNFAGTIHSFVGATLQEGILDCLHFTRTPTRDDMLKAYLGISRTSFTGDREIYWMNPDTIAVHVAVLWTDMHPYVLGLASVCYRGKRSVPHIYMYIYMGLSRRDV